MDLLVAAVVSGSRTGPQGFCHWCVNVRMLNPLKNLKTVASYRSFDAVQSSDGLSVMLYPWFPV